MGCGKQDSGEEHQVCDGRAPYRVGLVTPGFKKKGVGDMSCPVDPCGLLHGVTWLCFLVIYCRGLPASTTLLLLFGAF